MGGSLAIPMAALVAMAVAGCNGGSKLHTARSERTGAGAGYRAGGGPNICSDIDRRREMAVCL